MKRKLIVGTVVFLLFFSVIMSTISVNSEQINIKNTTPRLIKKDLDDSSSSPGSIFGKTYMVEMRDGIHLATDAYDLLLRPAPHGTILIRTPYDKDALSILGSLFSLFGWPTVIQDMRGRHASEGIDTLFQNSHTD